MTVLSRRTLAAGFAVALVASACAQKNDAAAQSAGAVEPLEIVTSDGKAHKFQVEIADTEPERQLGLMNRASMARDRGMLFKFEDEAPRSFWMRNTYIPLDIIYVASDGRIVSIAKMAQPLSDVSLPSDGPAKGVVEINGGLSDELNIRPGDRVRHPFFRSR